MIDYRQALPYANRRPSFQPHRASGKSIPSARAMPRSKMSSRPLSARVAVASPRGSGVNPVEHRFDSRSQFQLNLIQICLREELRLISGGEKAAIAVKQGMDLSPAGATGSQR